MNGGISEMTPDERTDFISLLHEKNLANAQEIRVQGRKVEHIYSIVAGRFMRWLFDPSYVRRNALKEYVRGTPEGFGWRLQRLPAEAQDAVALAVGRGQILPTTSSPEVTAFLDTAPDPEKDIIQCGKEAVMDLRLRPSCMLSEKLPLLWWVETIDTLTVHYLSRVGGGQLTREVARCGLADRTFRYRLEKIRKWDLIGAARKPPVKLPVARN